MFRIHVALSEARCKLLRSAKSREDEALSPAPFIAHSVYFGEVHTEVEVNSTRCKALMDGLILRGHTDLNSVRLMSGAWLPNLSTICVCYPRRFPQHIGTRFDTLSHQQLQGL